MKEAAWRIDMIVYYYTSKYYSDAWSNSCYKAQLESRPSERVAAQNVLNFKDGLDLPTLSAVGELKVTTYIFAFLILKASSFKYLRLINRTFVATSNRLF